MVPARTIAAMERIEIEGFIIWKMVEVVGNAVCELLDTASPLANQHLALNNFFLKKEISYEQFSKVFGGFD